jgi:molybdopterin molybdotransferase
MAQLTDDCFAFSGPLLPLAQMERLIEERVTPLATRVRVPLAQAAGRVLAEDLLAPLALPPFDNSAVDGFAVRHADVAVQGETRLRIVDRVAAGHSATQTLRAQEAIRIFTGAPMPPGADTVFMQEDCRVEGDSVIVPSGLKRGANRRAAGEDVPVGALVLPRGRRLTARDVALAAAMGQTQLDVFAPVRVALFSTGDEIVEPGRVRVASNLFDANRYLLAGLLRRLGAVVTDLGILKDEPEGLRRAIAEAVKTHDLVLTSGGVSTGEADHVRAAVEAIGKLIFWRVAIKPGRPVAMGVIDGTAFVGLPGNPAAAYVTFVRVVRPLLLRLSGATVSPLVPQAVRAGFDYKKKAGRREYVRVTLRRGADGVLEAQKYPREGAGIITSLTETDGLAELDEDMVEIEKGTPIGFYAYAVLEA